MSSTRVRWQAVLERFNAGVTADRPFYLAVAAFVCLSSAYLALTGRFHGPDVRDTFFAYAKLWLLDAGIVLPLFYLALGYIRITIRTDERRGLAYRHVFGPRRLGRYMAGTLMMLAGFLPFRTMFNSVKNVIPEGQGFPYDKFFADFDQVLHFGVAPWEWLYSFMRHPWILRVIEINYGTVWFIICFFTQYVVAVSPRFDRVRIRYVFCFMLVWVIIGNVFATIFSSAGPIYYGAVTGDYHRFADLMVFTASSSGQFAATTDFQHYLWDLFLSKSPGLGSGISAFPSMHVAIIMMNVLFLAEAGRKWLVPGLVYLCLTVVSSVYLGWHYAVDGYASIVMTAAIYFALKKIMSVRWRWGTTRPGVEAVAG